MAETKFGTFDDLLETAAESFRPIMVSLKKIILEIDPNATEVVRLGDRAATFGVGPKKMSEGYCYIMPHKSWVNLGFYKGAHLDDPNGLLEGTGKSLRHIKIRSSEDVVQAGVRKLIEDAFEERKTALGH